MRIHPLVVALLLLAAPLYGQDPAQAPAAGTGRPERVRVAVNGGFQSSTLAFHDVRRFEYFVETATRDAGYDVAAAATIDAGATVRLWRQFGAGVGVTRTSRKTAIDLSARYPHPFFYDRMRALSWSDLGATLSETAVHVSATYTVPASPRFDVTAFGGPSFFSYEQGVVQEVTLTEIYPYDTLEGTPAMGAITGSAAGYHAGVDVGWYITRTVGVGGLVRFTGARRQTKVGDGQPFELKLGGLQAGAGVRLRF